MSPATKSVVSATYSRNKVFVLKKTDSGSKDSRHSAVLAHLTPGLEYVSSVEWS